MLSTSQKMKIILENHGYSQTWLAEKWGISQQSISKKFRDNNWKEKDIQKFCEILGINYNITFVRKNGDIII